jgi:hypothetical protein
MRDVHWTRLAWPRLVPDLSFPDPEQNIFSAPCTVDIDLSPTAARKRIDVVTEAVTETLLVFESHEDVTGEVVVHVNAGKRVEHQGVKVELLGQIEMYYDRCVPLGLGAWGLGALVLAFFLGLDWRGSWRH